MIYSFRRKKKPKNSFTAAGIRRFKTIQCHLQFKSTEGLKRNWDFMGLTVNWTHKIERHNTIAKFFKNIRKRRKKHEMRSAHSRC